MTSDATQDALPLTAPRGVEDALGRAALPAPLQALVRDVVRRTRLWKRERIDLVQELAAHFADGLGAGRSIEQLYESFGDASAAARLIRRAKKRNRPRWWRAWIRAWQAMGLLTASLFVIYMVLVVRYFGGRPNISHNYLAELNRQATSLPESQRGWPIYREALLAMPTLRELRGRADQITPGGTGWEDVLEALHREATALQLLADAAARPGMGYVAGFRVQAEDQALWPAIKSESDSSAEHQGLLIAVQLPHLSELRKVGRIVAWDVRAAMEEGDGRRVLRDLATMIGIAEHVSEPPVIISELISLSVFTEALETLGAVLVAGPEVLEDGMLAELAHRIAAYRGGGSLRVRLTGERYWFEDFLQHAYTDDGRGDGRLTRIGLQTMDGVIGPNFLDVGDLFMPLAGLVVAGRQEMTHEYERLMGLMEADFNTPLWRLDRFRADDEIDRAMSSSFTTRWRHFPITLLMPAIDKAHVNAQLAGQRRDGMLAALALERFRREHGSWPASLQELVPRFMPAVPADVFDGQPIRYRLIDGRPVLYSVGTDRDDDGGMAPRPHAEGRAPDPSRWLSPSAVQHYQSLPDAATHLPDGDWVLWPKAEPAL